MANDNGLLPMDEERLALEIDDEDDEDDESLYPEFHLIEMPTSAKDGMERTMASKVLMVQKKLDDDEFRAMIEDGAMVNVMYDLVKYARFYSTDLLKTFYY